MRTFGSNRRLLTGALGAVLLVSAYAAAAQPTSNTVIGPPQLKDFRLEPNRPAADRPIVPLPAPSQAPTTTRVTPPPAAAQRPQPAPATAPPPASATSRPDPGTIRPQPSAAAPQRPVRPAPGPSAPAGAEPPVPNAVTGNEAVPDSVPVPMPATEPEAAPAAPAPSESGRAWWLFGLPAILLVLLGAALLRRRRAASIARAEALEAAAADARTRAEAHAAQRARDLAAARAAAEARAPAVAPEVPAPAVAAASGPRPDPIPRPWLEFSLKAERASFTDSEAEVLFELEIANKGDLPARNLRLDIKMFNAGAEQDQEIGAFFSTAGRETTKLNLPEVDAGITGVIKGRVTMARDEMRAVRLDERLLFIPVIAVNGLYDWGEGRSGQTSRSYVIGREVEQPGEKMGAFRVDQGPRVWRTVGQRPHKLAKRV